MTDQGAGKLSCEFPDELPEIDFAMAKMYAQANPRNNFNRAYLEQERIIESLVYALDQIYKTDCPADVQNSQAYKIAIDAINKTK